MIGSEKTCHVANVLIFQNVVVGGPKKRKTFWVYLVSVVHC